MSKSQKIKKLSPSTLKEIKARREKLKGTPWRQEHLKAECVATEEGYRVAEACHEYHEGFEVFERNDKAEFIANAPTDIDSLLEEVKRLKKYEQFHNELKKLGGFKGWDMLDAELLLETMGYTANRKKLTLKAQKPFPYR